MTTVGGLYYWLLMSSFVLLAVHAQDCPKPTTGPANTVLISADILKPTFPDGTTATWECETGYVIEGGDKRQTCSAGTWTPAVVTLECDRKSCGSIPEPSNGRIDFPEGNQFGDKAVITCDTGYNLVPAHGNERSCGADGTWMGRFGRCEVVKCGKPVDIENGRFSPVNDDYDYGNVVTYKCNKGFTRNGTESLDCRTDGQFHPAPPTCIIVKCETPNVPNLERFEGPPPPYGYKHHVTFKCVDGFEMVGSPSVTCEISGWSPPLPRCKAIPTTPTTTTTTTTTSTTTETADFTTTTSPPPTSRSTTKRSTTPPETDGGKLPDPTKPTNGVVPTPNNTPTIVGSVIGVISFVVFGVGCCVYLKKKRSKRSGLADNGPL